MVNLGRAEKLLLAQERNLFSREKETGSFLNWPYIASLVQREALETLDVLSAERILSDFDKTGEDEVLFIAFLIAASRQGHLAVDCQRHQILPKPLEIWPEAAKNHADFELLLNRLYCGSLKLAEIAEEMDTSFLKWPQAPICRLQSLYYLQRNFIDESYFISLLQEFETSPPTLQPDLTLLKSKLDALSSNDLLLPQQRLAIENGMRRRLSFIMGGPGTGKTYTAGLLIKIFLESLPQGITPRVALAAPTGKAAKNLEESIKRWVKDSNGQPIVAHTLHSLLAVNASERLQNDDRILPHDLLLIDESSMIDLKLFIALLKQIKLGARLVLIGDPYQLPPVEIGGVFADLVAIESDSSLQKGVALKECLRAELDTIVSLAEAINNGDSARALHDLATKEGLLKVNLPKEEQPYQLKKRIVQYTLPFFPVVDPKLEPALLLAAFRSFRLLSPLRKGAVGVDALNQSFVERFVANQKSFVAPIMIASNDKTLNLANGDVGVLVKRGEGLEDFFALFPSKEEGYRQIPAALLPRYEYAYCLSVHKSQGSEFDEVVIAMPPGSEIFGREVFYTAVTRAKKKVTVLASDETLKKAIKSSSKRLSGLKARLK